MDTNNLPQLVNIFKEYAHILAHKHTFSPTLWHIHSKIFAAYSAGAVEYTDSISEVG